MGGFVWRFIFLEGGLGNIKKTKHRIYKFQLTWVLTYFSIFNRLSSEIDDLGEIWDFFKVEAFVLL